MLCLFKTCDIFLHMSEKEIAVLSFPDRNGIIDYLGFEGNDESTLDWCNDVFNYYWNNSKPVNIFQQEDDQISELFSLFTFSNEPSTLIFKFTLTILVIFLTNKDSTIDANSF